MSVRVGSDWHCLGVVRVRFTFVDLENRLGFGLGFSVRMRDRERVGNSCSRPARH